MAALLGASAITVAFVSETYVVWAAVGWAAVAGVAIVLAHAKTQSISKKFNGPILEFVFAPTPMGSVFASLAKHNVARESISKITLMSCDIKESLRYFESGTPDGSFFKALDACPDMSSTVYGFSQDPHMQSGHPRMDLVVTRDKFYEHTNLITTKDGKSFVWYEPCHLVANGEHYFTRGAYLLSIDEATKSKIEHDYANLARQLVA